MSSLLFRPTSARDYAATPIADAFANLAHHSILNVGAKNRVALLKSRRAVACAVLSAAAGRRRHAGKSAETADVYNKSENRVSFIISLSRPGSQPAPGVAGGAERVK